MLDKSLLDFMNCNNALWTAAKLCVRQLWSQNWHHRVAVEEVPVRNAWDGHEGARFQEHFRRQSHSQPATHTPRPLTSS